MSSEETRSKRFHQRKRNIYAKELEKLKPVVFKSDKQYKRENLKPKDVDKLLQEDYDE